jgi:hypothetical protein
VGDRTAAVSVPLPNSAIHVLTVARSSWSLPGIAGDVIIIMGKTGSHATIATRNLRRINALRLQIQSPSLP